ncbi:GNAT family N-acetyltransferase [Actinoplanes derwentensis]|uniref:GNAT family N-acetyltransferase n=1 Tax=Actinoplanes derwentensis TaxID=113562 RepID=UPI000B88B457|nr:GNAT family N-acetyltransferase [Actinoplanes derwentensis]
MSFWLHLARCTSGTYWKLPRGVMVDTGIDGAAYNQVHCRADDEESIAEAAGYFGKRGLPWRVVSSGPASVTTVRGVEREPLYPIMSRDAVASEDAAVRADGLVVEVARTVDDVQEFVDCAADSFGYEPKLLEAICGPETVADERFQLYLGRSEGRVVAVAAGVSVPKDRTIGVYFVGVRPESRNRGFGRSVTARVIGDGAAGGAVTAVLQATPAGVPVYTGMGFAPVGDYLLWDFPHADPSHA